MKNFINSFSSDDGFQPCHGGEKDRRQFNLLTVKNQENMK